MSVKSRLSPFWTTVQLQLFPIVEKRLGKISEKHKKLIAILELVRIEKYIGCTKGWGSGRTPKDRVELARAFVAKFVLNLANNKQLAHTLQNDSQLRTICGWESNNIPSLSKFSRVFKEFAELKIAERTHEALIEVIYNERVAGHIVKDSTPIEVREKPLKKGSAAVRKKIKNDKRYKGKTELNRRQKQLLEPSLDKMINDLPNHCDIGMKKSAMGYTQIWKGYKVHAAIDDDCIPVAVIVTSASLNDCEAAIPLATKASKVMKNYYDLMDAAYDHKEIKEHSISLGHVPIIDKCPINSAEKMEKLEEKERRKLLNFKTAEEVRYQKRLPKERFNALYKDFCGGRNILYRGHLKVTSHVMFGVLVATATTIIKLIQ